MDDDVDFTTYLTDVTNKTDGAQNVISKRSSNIKDEIAIIELNISRVTADIESNNMRLSHLRSNYKTVDNLMLQLDEITKRIDLLQENQRRSYESSVSTFFTRDSRLRTENNQIPDLESSCMRTIRETCENISSYFACEYHENVGIKYDNTRKRTVTKESLWTQVEDIAKSFKPNDIHEALLLNTKESKINLEDLCSRIDLKSDAENLKFMFETGKLKDVSTKPALVQTVQQLIEEGEVSHFQKFVAIERFKNESWKLEKCLQDLNNSINEALKNNFPTERAQKIRNVLSLEQEHDSHVVSLQFLQGELMKLKVEREDKEHAVSHLLRKYNRIQNFDKTCQAKQKVIQDLIKTNGSAKSRHRQQLQDIKTSTEEKIIKIHSDLSHLYKRYEELVFDEVCNYFAIPIKNLECLRSSSDKKTLVSDMSIHRLNGKYEQPGEESFRTIAENMNIPQYAPPELIIPEVMKSKNNAHQSTKQVEETNVDVSKLHKATREISEIQENLSCYHGDDVRTSLLSLEESKLKCADVTTECTNFRTAVQHWWDQPAQHKVPWVNEDGLNLSQCLDRFSTQVTLLKKMQLVN